MQSAGGDVIRSASAARSSFTRHFFSSWLPVCLHLRTMANRKSVLLSLVLTFFFGPFGMLYSTVPGALIMLVLYVALGIPTLGWAIAVLHPIAMIWGAIAADRANR
ncbi:hypothetical protein SAMN05443244_1795 [Terriglobus roseus]|uniref:Uncharacterized protein n=2 Tax=Terriglobus roseus TaxID=392734 RepID=A0A1H4M1Y8_9BACT|nr:hypothetical protein SAMN05443244_1795 [Terriglobus roseus]